MQLSEQFRHDLLSNTKSLGVKVLKRLAGKVRDQFRLSKSGLVNTNNLKDSWKAEDVARQQAELVEKELQDPLSVAPFKTFIDVIKYIIENYDYKVINFLDVGCGVGHYSELLHRYFPGQFLYTGSDFSESMIKIATEQRPHSQFIVDDIFDSRIDFSEYDIVMASALVDVIEDFWSVLDIFFRNSTGLLILHRQRITDKKSYSEVAPGYKGQFTYATYLNMHELEDRLSACDLYIKERFNVADGIYSFLIDKKKVNS